MGLLADWQIKKLVKIEPFAEEAHRPGVVSYGVSSYGYDCRVGRSFQSLHQRLRHGYRSENISTRARSSIIEGDFCVIPPNSFGPGGKRSNTSRSPRDVLATCLGKSTYARLRHHRQRNSPRTRMAWQDHHRKSATRPPAARQESTPTERHRPKSLFFKADQGVREELRGQEGEVSGSERAERCRLL